MIHAPKSLVAAAWTALFLGTAQGQAPSPSPEPSTVALTAGEHSLRELVALLSRVGARPIEIAKTADATLDRQVSLQTEVSLAEDDLEDLTTMLLDRHGLLLVPGTAPRTARVLVAAELEEPQALAREATLEDLRTRPDLVDLVRIELDRRQWNVARPWFASRPPGLGGGDAGSLDLRPDPEAAGEFWGLRPRAAFVANLDALATGQAPEAPTGWFQAGKDLAWPGGEMETAAFADLTARTLGINIDHQLDAATLDLGEAATIHAEAWFARATTLLHEAGIGLAPWHEASRLWAARPTSDRAFFTVHAPSVPAAWIDEHAPQLFVLSAIDLDEDINTALNRIRPLMAAHPVTLTMSQADSSRLVIGGMTADLHAILEAMRRPDKDG